ncbi:predicted protein [Histoplasma capsulatum var. duboisii H88]|uniref:Uncharacterized protein n=2 Tax=Ajellomyces capsulatus TaxID=5037 RepID=C0NF08_AJECG|nr:uncharacterized protein HCBG_01474 [Histoplasma capsulatum G186AR]EEH09829.1 predicted protein [Histoplasma capsulatum G186AR]EGC44302.1 predicted protein [Histoplasma capsulatum var. duboisii H88]
MMGPTKLTHEDLHQGNILISPAGEIRLEITLHRVPPPGARLGDIRAAEGSLGRPRTGHYGCSDLDTKLKERWTMRAWVLRLIVKLHLNVPCMKVREGIVKSWVM